MTIKKYQRNSRTLFLLYNEKSYYIFFSDTWLWTVFNSSLFLFPLCPISGHTDRTDYVLPYVLPLSAWRGIHILNKQTPPVLKLSPYPLPNYNKNPDKFPFFAGSKHLGLAWEACPRDLNYVNNKTFYTFFGMCCFISLNIQTKPQVRVLLPLYVPMTCCPK